MTITSPKTAVQVAAEETAKRENDVRVKAETDAAVKAATDNALAIVQLCALAGLPHEAAALIEAKKTPDEARQILEAKKGESAAPAAPDKDTSAKGQAEAAAKNATANAVAITQLCALAGLPAEASALIEANKTPDEARGILAAKKASSADALVTDGKPPQANKDTSTWDSINAIVHKETGLTPRA